MFDVPSNMFKLKLKTMICRSIRVHQNYNGAFSGITNSRFLILDLTDSIQNLNFAI